MMNGDQEQPSSFRQNLLAENYAALWRKEAKTPKKLGIFAPPIRGNAATEAKLTVKEVAVQVDEVSENALEAVRNAHDVITDRPPEQRPLPELRKRPSLVVFEESAVGTRKEVAEGRVQLREFDGKVSRLTRELKLAREENWKRQQELSACEERINAILREGVTGVPQSRLEESDALLDEYGTLSSKLAEARAELGYIVAEAKKQDASLQEFEAHSRDGITALCNRHPAGIVTPSRLHPGFNDQEESDEEDYDQTQPPRRYPPVRNAEDVALDSSDEESTAVGSARAPESVSGSEVSTAAANEPRRRGLPGATGVTDWTVDDEISEASSVQSPNSDSGSCKGIGSIEANSGVTLPGKLKLQPSSDPKSPGPSVGDSTPSSDGDDDSKGPRKVATAKSPADVTPKPSAAVPSLPSLSGKGAMAALGSNNVDEDDNYDSDFVEEEILTSRSSRSSRSV
jgi:cell division septum initiation protein DivIVA